MTPRERAESMIEIVDRNERYQSMRFKGQSGFLWHSSDRELMQIRKKEMVDAIEKCIIEAVDAKITERADLVDSVVCSKVHSWTNEWASSWLPPVKFVDMKPFESVEVIPIPKVDDTKEFNLVRCPKCELMVEELVVTPYRQVCANCAKGS